MTAMAYRTVPDIQDCAERLELIFPRLAFDTVLSSPGAGAAVAAMLYVDAIVPDDGPVPPDAQWVRPTTCLWLSMAAYKRDDAASRTAYYRAAIGGNAKAKMEALHREWGTTHKPLYGDNSRETLRDETFPAWLDHTALRVRPGIKTTSPAPRWALTSSFADLFDPALQGDALSLAIDAWREAHMTPGARLKALTAAQREQTTHAVEVRLPNGDLRSLEPGEASVIGCAEGDERGYGVGMSDYTIVDADHVDDFYAGTDVPGEFRSLTDALESDQLAATLIRVPPHCDFEQGTGHRHDELEELYIVTRGALTMRFGDDVRIVTAGSVVRVAPSTVRSHRNEGDEPVEMWAISRLIQHGDATKVDDFWDASPRASQRRDPD